MSDPGTTSVLASALGAGATLPLGALGVAAAGGLLGSAHCVGMCGPFAGYAQLGASAGWSRHAAYQLGRLATYASLGVVAGLFGHALTRLSAALDVQRALALAMGVSLIAMGLGHAVGWRLSTRLAAAQGRAGGAVIRLARAGGGAAGSFLLGLGSTLLPCGFLYAFAFAAAATGTLAGALATLLGFWAGTLPALAGTAWLARAAGVRVLAHSHRAIGVVLIALGVLGIFGRSTLLLPPVAGGGEPASATCCEH